MFANVSSARRVSRWRLFNRCCTCCTAIATGTSRTTFQGWPIEEERADGQVGEPERDDGNEVVQQTQTAGLSAGEAEREPACAGSDHRGARIEDHGPHGKAPKESNRDDAGGCDECARPGPEDDQSTDLDRGGKPEALPLHRLARALAVRLLEQLHEDDRRQEEGERRVGDVGQLGERDREHGQAEPDRGQE